MDADAFTFLLASLAVWRICHLIALEDGPGDVIVRLRRRLGDGLLGRLVDCVFCLSVWVAAPCALLFRPSPVEFVLLWLALSGAACVIERVAGNAVVIEPLREHAGRSDR